MASLVVRNLDDRLKERLRVRAALHGRSMEAEVRQILERELPAVEKGETAFDLFNRYFGEENGFDIEPYLPKREGGREPPTFD